MDKNEAYANALAAAFASDMDTPAVAAAIKDGGLTREQFTRIVNRDVSRGLTDSPGPVLFPAVRAFARQVVDIAAIKKAKSSGLSDTTSSDIGGIAGLVGAIAGAVGAIWSTKINTDSQKKLATIQASEAQIVQNSQTLAAKSALIKNATANGVLVAPDGSLSDPNAGIVAAGPLATIGGISPIMLGTAAIAMLAGGYYYAKG